MNRDDIIRMAEKAGCGWIQTGTGPALFGEEQIAKFANLIAAYEREECAKACEQVAANPSSLWEEAGCWVHSSENCIAAIRVRSEK
jgi:hypothetical protein